MKTKKNLFLAFALVFCFASLNAQPLFSVSQNDFSKEVLAQLLTQIEKSETSPLTLTKNKQLRDYYPVTLTSEENTKIIILNEHSGAHVVLAPVVRGMGVTTPPTELQLAAFFIEELKLGVLGNAERFLVVVANDLKINVFSASTLNGEVYIPKYFYGSKENVQEALPVNRQIVSISKMKPRYIPADPNNPESIRFAKELAEANSYYVYTLKLPDGTLCTYDENMNP